MALIEVIIDAFDIVGLSFCDDSSLPETFRNLGNRKFRELRVMRCTLSNHFTKLLFCFNVLEIIAIKNY
jgi:hypothetical protein